MKELTGGDPIQGRALYCDTVTYKPQFSLVVCTNHLFDIKSTDDGTWRRIRVVDFESKFVDEPSDDPDKHEYKKDRTIAEKFKKWAPYLASLLVKIAFDTEGIVEDCECVMASSQKYKLKQDYFAQFLEERIVPEEGCSIKRHDVLHEFTEWYGELYGGKVPKGKELYEFLDEKLLKSNRLHERVWKGYRLIHSYEDDLDIEPNNI